tara:strand:- start:19930 stop:20676 length:747 start_codon:yes stop_codon:yes gene_type:complete
MRVYKVNGIDNRVFDPDDEVTLPKGSRIVRDWRKAEVGDWVRADDECIIQILRKGMMYKPKGKKKACQYVGTCTGTFPVRENMKMDTSRRINIYSFGGGKTPDDILIERTKLSTNERLFVVFLAKGWNLEEAYLKAFSTKNPRYARTKAAQLIQTKRVSTAMKEDLKPVCEELGIDEKLVLKGIKDEALDAEKPDVRLKALFKLSDILDLEDKNRTTVQQVTGVAFQGFGGEALDTAIRPAELPEDNG